MAILFHPTHRKFIQLLRTHADRGTIIKYTDLDKKRVRELFFRTNNALERHKSIYKIALEILNRNTPAEEGCTLTHDMVDIIEKNLVQAERRKPCNTFQGVVFMSLLKSFIKKNDKYGVVHAVHSVLLSYAIAKVPLQNALLIGLTSTFDE